MILLAILLLFATPAWAAPDVAGVAFAPRPGNSLPGTAVFSDEAGRPIHLGELWRGRPVILALGYYHCPNLCGVVRADLFSALAAGNLRAGIDYDAIVVSIDPAETSAQAAAAKAQDIAQYPAPGAAAGWHFLSGPNATLQEAVGYRARWDERLRQFIHPAGVVAITPAGVVSSYLLGVGYEPQLLERAIRQAAAGGIAAPPSPVLLLCFHYDAATGRYSLAIERVLQVLALFTVAGIAATLALLHRRRAGT